MYHKIGIHRLSPTQISKLLNGHKIRVKHGQGHEIHASEEQHKKIMTAHRKGKAHTMQFDPFQIAQHQHLRHGHGEGMKHAVHHRPVHHAHMHHGNGEGEGFFGSIARAVAPTLIDYGANALKNRLGNGEGIRHRGRPRKHHASMGEGKGRRRRGKGEGEGMHSRSRYSHKSHGEALYPAGYGEGDGMMHGYGEGMKRRGRKSRGEGPLGSMIGSHLGSLAGNFLPF